jgi:hypothetical protein
MMLLAFSDRCGIFMALKLNPDEIEIREAASLLVRSPGADEVTTVC